ncbi:FAD-binding domain-containing protein [Dendrothele bispora CBS 962.96]|uniref:FAD-binding domain-containing protein n=1 Tax=Dendrothele bispora (strain CBS 962.96) TaxID=1314807 RepID=A0A4V4HF03_DENBC|nr:FAD-binding domain-containing protein [Dendrothele bispora CBS 962.96]
MRLVTLSAVLAFSLTGACDQVALELQPGPINARDCCTTLEGFLPGKVHWPSSSTYKAQQNSYYSAEQSSLSPACRVSPTSAFDVSTIVNVAREGRCPFAVRTGGHMSWNGASNVGSAGFTVDMQAVRGVSVSDDGSNVSFGSGCRWREVYSALKPRNLTTVGGRVGDVGVSGFLLGGGIGFLSAEHGFGSDSVVNYEVVLADGSIVNANSREHPDLFWALKLGSTNFGIVTRFDMVTYPQQQVWGGSQFFALKDARALLDGLVSFTDKLAEEPKGFFGLSIAWNPEAQDYIIWTLQTYLEAVAHPPLWSDFESLTPMVDMMGIKNLTDITEEFQEADPGKQGRSQWLSMTFKPDAQFHLDLHAKGIELFEPYHERPGVHWAVSIQPIPSTLSKASSRRGGNPSRLTEDEGGLWVMLITTNWVEPIDDDIMKSTSQLLLQWAEDEARARGLFRPFIYMNYAFGSQSVLERSVDEESLQKMCRVRETYDPAGVLEGLWRGGFKLPGRSSLEYDRTEL